MRHAAFRMHRVLEDVSIPAAAVDGHVWSQHHARRDCAAHALPTLRAEASPRARAALRLARIQGMAAVRAERWKVGVRQVHTLVMAWVGRAFRLLFACPPEGSHKDAQYVPVG